VDPALPPSPVPTVDPARVLGPPVQDRRDGASRGPDATLAAWVVLPFAVLGGACLLWLSRRLSD
jgi:hypothetical protein